MTDWKEKLTSKKFGCGVLVVLGVLVLMLVLILFWSFARPARWDSGSTLSCDDLKEMEVVRSENLLRASLSGSITAVETELENVQSELRVKRTDLAAKEADLATAQDDLANEEGARDTAQAELVEREVESEQVLSELSVREADLRVAEDAGEDEEQIDELNLVITSLEQRVEALNERIRTLKGRIGSVNDTIGPLNETIGSLNETIGSLNETIAALVRSEAAIEARLEEKNLARSAMLSKTEREAESERVRSELSMREADLLKAEDADEGQQEIQELTDGIRLLEGKIAYLNDPRWALVAGSDADTSGVYLPPRSAVNLVPDVPVAHIDLGTHRAPSRVEIVLERALFGGDEDSSTLAENGETKGAPTVELPDKATYFTEVGQFRRSEGLEIPAEQISSWARRVGSAVILSVCVSPIGIHPGMYEGDVYLVDPSLNPTKVRVEVTAQSEWIRGLYLLVIMLPLAALIYVWVTARYTAEENPWELKHLLRWLSHNSVGLFVVGFAAVWATLQVPLNNPTWGSSAVNAAAVVGVGLVAAVTAMTVVAGRVRGKDMEEEDGGADEQDGKS